MIVLWLIAIVGFGIFERIADPKTFPTIWLAWWWAIQTVTTVGYGDVVPQQAAGKAVAAVLMVGGLAFLSIVTATVSPPNNSLVWARVDPGCWVASASVAGGEVGRGTEREGAAAAVA